MRVLIANRGEIAIRIAKAVKELGMTPIGLITNFEKEALHLHFCDEWIEFLGNNNQETYLNAEAIIALAKEHNIDGIHPGYGFLAENASFIGKCKKAGITFIGPHQEAVASLGDKATSKKIAAGAGVPTIPGSIGEVDTVKEACEIANKIGFPVLLKATAGGGGRGMRKCHNKEEVENNFEPVKREAASSFGYDGLLVEKFIENPHHIEVQIIANKKGTVLHCFERECSIQRRNQKVIEEAPSPFIGNDQKVRLEICESAVKLAKTVNYDSAGTVEFVMGADKKFYFLEMNTRIQVEHPITEEVTNMDLLVMMIQSAFELDWDIEDQEDIELNAHSIECRICAEDPKTLLPSPGKVLGFHYDLPVGTRFDHCLYEGAVVTPDFDPMVGKLITTGRNRQIALRKMKSALKGLHIFGLKNNIPLHQIILENKTFASGEYTTQFIEMEKPHEDPRLDFITGNLVDVVISSEVHR